MVSVQRVMEYYDSKSGWMFALYMYGAQRRARFLQSNLSGVWSSEWRVPPRSQFATPKYVFLMELLMEGCGH